MLVGIFSFYSLYCDLFVANNISSIPVAAFIEKEGHHHHGDKFTIYYSFMTNSEVIHPSSFAWDPFQGIEYSQSPGKDTLLYLSTYLQVFALVPYAEVELSPF
jgi:hypothetical protein